MTFSVHTVALAGLPTLLDRLGEDARFGTAGLDADVAVPTAEDEPAAEDEEPDELFHGLEHERW